MLTLSRMFRSCSPQTPDKGLSDSPKDSEPKTDGEVLEGVSAKLAGLSTDDKPKPDRLAQLSNPFDDSDDEEDDGPIDLSDYTEEEIGYVL